MQLLLQRFCKWFIVNNTMSDIELKQVYLNEGSACFIFRLQENDLLETVSLPCWLAGDELPQKSVIIKPADQSLDRPAEKMTAHNNSSISVHLSLFHM